VLIVDEAHNLSTELLEEIRLLSNLETNSDKLLQIVLVGQPELDLKLDSFELRPLKQRIALRAHLSPLDEEDTGKYILERLVIAGGGSRTEPLFSPESVKSIHHYSRGFPRLINTICENCLITGYARQLTTITPDIVAGVAKDFHLTTNGTKVGMQAQAGEPELERAKNFFLGLYASMHGPKGSDSELPTPITAEAGKNESDI
jgi:general secretion pathway protein A